MTNSKMVSLTPLFPFIFTIITTHNDLCKQSAVLHLKKKKL